MSYINAIQSDILYFARKAKENGWTKEEVMSVVNDVREEIRQKDRDGKRYRFLDILKKHAIPVIERKKREQENIVEPLKDK